MQTIINNPYRIVGILGGATAREQERQVKRLKQYLEAEQEPESDYSFPILGIMQRSVDRVSEAASKLNLDHDKLNAAIFWFYNGNAITDEPAFDAIKDGEVQNAVEIWLKMTSSGEITQRNYSAFQNLSTLQLCKSLNGSSVNQSLFDIGLTLKLKFLESDYVNDFKAGITDETYKVSKKDIQLSFLNTLQHDLEKYSGVSASRLIEILSKLEFAAKEDFIQRLVQRPIEQIGKRVEATKTKRRADKSVAGNAGIELYDAVNAELVQLKSTLGVNNLKYSSIADKVSGEILQCGIDYFKHYRDTNTDPGNITLDLFKKAQSLAVGNIARQRAQENTENLQEWIKDKPVREKQAKIALDLDYLTHLIDEYDKKEETVANAKQLLASASPFLNNIKSVLDNNDELYLGLSSRIASDAQSMCVTEINKLQERFSRAVDKASKMTIILLLKEKVNEAWVVAGTIGFMDLRPDFRHSYNSNKTSLSNLRSQLSQVNTEKRAGSSSGGGCYIATMAYGDYNHPQVIHLRGFRDNILAKSVAGKWLIKIYYQYSPRLVERLKDRKAVNFVIRKLLDQFVKLIK